MLSCTGCKRFVQKDDAACPFCGTARETAFAPIVLTMVLGVALAACGPSVVATDDAESTSGEDTSAEMGPGSSPTSTPSTTNTTVDTTAATSSDPDTSTTTTSTTTGVDDDATDDAGCAFYGCPPDGGGPGQECDVWAQDCVEGDKCMPWANDGGAHWNATKCSPLADAPDAPGDPCTVEGSAVSGLDSCDISSMCWDVDPTTNEGTCVAFCSGSPANPSCPDDPSTSCMSTFDGALNLCVPSCHPLLQDCSDWAACTPVGGEAFFCLPDTSGAEGQYGDGCEYIDACDPGLFCANPAAFPECDEVACCAEFCDLALPDPSSQCTNAELGVECVTWWDENEAAPGYETVGACIVPA